MAKTKKKRPHRGGAPGWAKAAAKSRGKKGKKAAARKTKKRGGAKPKKVRATRKHRSAKQKAATARMVAANRRKRAIALAKHRGGALTPEQKAELRIGRKLAKKRAYLAEHAPAARPSTGWTGGGFSPEVRARLEARKAAMEAAQAARFN